MYTLHISNKNYSSWSLKPWLLMRMLDIEFNERLHPLESERETEGFRKVSPSSKLPCLIDYGTGDNIQVWDSLSIIEYLAERHAGVWPTDPAARAWGRSAVAEMHSGFLSLRTVCPMSCGVRVDLKLQPIRLLNDLIRISQLWNEGIRQFDGPFLVGEKMTAVDAFFAPVVFCLQTYGLHLDEVSMLYTNMMLRVPAMREWYADALEDADRDDSYELKIQATGDVQQDFRNNVQVTVE